MKIGCLGEIIFEVSDKVVKTLQSATWGGSVSIHTHERHLDNSLQEFVSIDPDSFTFAMQLSAYLGVNPQEELNKIWNYERGGIAVSLTIGTKGYGKSRWLIKNHKIKMENYDKDGDLTSATVNVTLTEYI